MTNTETIKAIDDEIKRQEAELQRLREERAAIAQEENQDDPLFDAVLTCPHLITAESVTLYFHPAQQGHNASLQLRHRLAAYDLAARQRELQLLSEIEALERLALANLKQQDEIRAARKAAQEEVVDLKERIARAGVEQRRAVREAVLEEREACAKVCDPQPGIRYSPNSQSARQQCAAAIRARQ